jgi:hypothetical protein
MPVLFASEDQGNPEAVTQDRRKAAAKGIRSGFGALASRRDRRLASALLKGVETGETCNTHFSQE